ncbi:MAG TPA: sigma-70 family RNA polymerase sigma factor [Candidatus Eisenbacteria bacterium]|nr:sigma-70 family RNA polymerase sigma factor [Candidatus Eisenbacteria bacterium]
MGVPPPNLESTATLLQLVRHGDRPARERLAARYLQILRRLAHGRLPLRARDMMDTDDLVQVTLVRALDHVEDFEPRHEGAFLAYMRRILLNQIRDEIRRVARRPARSELESDPPAPDRSPLEEAIGRETVERYEAVLDQLREDQREAIILRLELGFTYQQIAEALGRDSPNAVRMMVTRALVRLGELLGGEPGDLGSTDES